MVHVRDDAEVAHALWRELRQVEAAADKSLACICWLRLFVNRCLGAVQAVWLCNRQLGMPSREHGLQDA